jgi:hypothetical protein
MKRIAICLSLLLGQAWGLTPTTLSWGDDVKEVLWDSKKPDDDDDDTVVAATTK